MSRMLFVEDFDIFEEPAVADVAAPAYDREAELAAEYARGLAEGLAHAEASRDQGARALVAHCAAECRRAEESLARLAEEAADQLAGLVFEALNTLVPSVCAACGPAETAAMARVLLPRLRLEPQIRVRLNPHDSAAMQAEVARLDEEIADRIVITPTDAMARGDLKVSWQDGMLLRDTAAIWREMSEALQRFGFLDAPSPRDVMAVPRAMRVVTEKVVEHAG